MATGTPNYAITPNLGAGATVSIGDTSRTAPASSATVITAGASGSRIERISLAALGPTLSSVLRLFLHDGTNPHLYAEVEIPGSSSVPGAADFNSTLEAVTVPNLMPLLLKAGWSLKVSINDTQLAQELAIDSVAQAQTLGAAGALSLNGSNVTGASNTAISALAAPTSGTPLTLTASPYVMAAPAQVTITSASNLSSINYLILGRDASGAIISETLAGPNAKTVFSVNVYASVLAVIPASTSASTASVGYSAVAGISILPLPSKIMLTSGGNLSGINFSIKGTASNGLVQSETLSGPNVGEVLSANVYASITSIIASAAVSSNVMVGNPPILSGISLLVNAGDF